MHKSFRNTLRDIFTDGGLIVFLLVVPVIYPLIYASIYDNEVVRDVPIAVVDADGTSFSRDFVRRLDASPDVRVVAHAPSLAAAQQWVRERKAYGVVHLPSQMARDVERGTPVRVQVYADMSGMLYYKAVLGATTDVSLQTNARIKVARAALAAAQPKAGNPSVTATARQEQLTTSPLTYEWVALFNPQSGFASFLLPAVLVLIVQQTLILGVGMAAGTRRERQKLSLQVSPTQWGSQPSGSRTLSQPSGSPSQTVSQPAPTQWVSQPAGSPSRPLSQPAPSQTVSRPAVKALWRLLGRSMAYGVIYIPVSMFVLAVVPRMFHFPQLTTFVDLALFLLPYLVAAVFFAITLSGLARERESIILVAVFSSIPMLFLSGVSWPGSAIPWVWKTLAAVIPSSPAINGYVRLSSMGASLPDVSHEWWHLWLLALVYGLAAWIVTFRSHQLFLHKKAIRGSRTLSQPSRTGPQSSTVD